MDYFRNRDDDTSDDDDESSDEEQRGDFVAGGIYAPAAQSITAAAAGLTMSIAAAAGIKRLVKDNTPNVVATSSQLANTLNLNPSTK